MTYCVALRLKRGLVLMSDTRTNAGVDNISVFPKTFHFGVPGERQLSILTAGNLATTQAVIALLEERSKAPADRSPGILAAPSMFQVARLVGGTLREAIREQTDAQGPGADPSVFSATLLLAGQIKGAPQRLYMVYPEGNFVECSDEAPYFQIGETKYGRPIIVRAFDPEMSFEAAIKLLLLSFDSTIKANLSVDLPIDMTVQALDAFDVPTLRRILKDDPYYLQISDTWGQVLRDGVASLPDYALL